MVARGGSRTRVAAWPLVVSGVGGLGLLMVVPGVPGVWFVPVGMCCMVWWWISCEQEVLVSSVVSEPWQWLLDVWVCL